MDSHTRFHYLCPKEMNLANFIYNDCMKILSKLRQASITTPSCDGLSREEVIEHFMVNHQLDLSGETDRGLEQYIAWTRDGGDPIEFWEASQQMATFHSSMTPAERETMSRTARAEMEDEIEMAQGNPKV